MAQFSFPELYEILSDRNGRLEREGPLLLGALHSAPKNKVADLACGTGLHALFLAQHGAEVYALDMSAAMITYARKKNAHPNIQYAVHDMCELPCKQFGVILCLGNSLSLLHRRTQVKKFFRNTYHALSPAGSLIVQILNYQNPALKRPRMRIEHKETERWGHIAAIKRFLPKKNKTVLEITYLTLNEQKMDERHELFLLAHWSAETLLQSAREAGFVDRTVFGGYDRRPLTVEAPDVLLYARRP